MLWGPSRHLGSLTAANWVSFDFNVSYSSCWGYSLINTFKLKKGKRISGRSGDAQARRGCCATIRCLAQIYSLYKHVPLAGFCFVFVNHVLVTRQHESGDIFTLYAGSDPSSLYYLLDLTCKRGSVGQSERLSIPRSSVRFRLKPDNSNSHEFELHRPSNKGTKLLLKVIKAIIIIGHRPPPATHLPSEEFGLSMIMQY